MKKIFAILICAVLCCFALTACNDSKPSEEDGDEAYAYCSTFYDAGLGNYGSFAISPLDDNELETNFDNLSRFTLSGAFTGMTLLYAGLSEDSCEIIFGLTGALSDGEYGVISGNGIIKGKEVEVSVPITGAEAGSESVIYGNAGEQQITLELMSACFNKDVSADDFVLSGAAKKMTVKAVSTDYAVDDDGEEVLSQTAVLTLEGEPDGSEYAYIEISKNATTFNQSLNVVLKTDYYGAAVLNDHIDTYTLYDTVYIQANNVSFNRNISKSDISFDGALKDYAVIENVDYVNENLLGLELKFPYTFISTSAQIGYINFAATADEQEIAFVCPVIVATPEVSYTLEIEGNNVAIKLSLEHEEFNLLDSYPFTLFREDGNEILVTNLEVVNMDEYLDISFTTPEDCKGILTFSIENAYSVIGADGEENITIKTYLYL